MFSVKNMVIALALLMPLVANAADKAPGKIAIIMFQEAILSTETAQQRLGALRESDSFKRNREEFEALQQEGQKLLEQLKKDGAVMSQQQKAEVQSRMSDIGADLEHVRRKLKEAEQEVGKRLVMEMRPKFLEAVKVVVAEENIGLLLDAQAAIHAENEYNITAKVIEKLNQMK